MIQMQKCHSLNLCKAFMRVRLLIPVLCFFFVSFNTFSQRVCGVHESDHEHHLQELEKWLLATKSSNRFRLKMDEVLTVPVVFHIIHNGEDLGSGTNIPDERILEQVDILNADFNRQNADTTNTPSEFLEVAASPNIRFQLARQDPEGLPTTGITRQVGTQSEYRINENAALSNVIHWPSEDYINIYVANLRGVFGWAEFPFSNIEGIPEINFESELDGVFLDSDFVGLNASSPSFPSFGRTATHEIGHYLGLRHVYGDGGCEADDFCSDTPASSVTYSGSCPSTSQSSCGSEDMYSNYLYLTDDECMNVFTQCQKERMRTVLQNSPRRMTLLSSSGLNEPISIANDLGIREVRMPLRGECESAVTPQVIVRNYGTNTISQFQITIAEPSSGYSESITVNTGLELLELQSVSFSELSLNSERNLTFTIDQVNNTSDVSSTNNSKTIKVSPSNASTLPYLQSFDNNEETILQSNSEVIASVALAPNETTSNNALLFPFYQESRAFGSKQLLVLPNLDLTGVTSANLVFDFAYANDSTDSFDGLVVAYSTDCGANYNESQYLFEQFGDRLKTTSRIVAGAFSPIGPSEWRSASINITSLLNESDLRLAIFGVNGSGNNIYLDNINLQVTQLQAYDLALTSLDRVPVVTCDGNITAEIRVSNEGFETITSFNANVSVNGNSTTTALQSSISSGSQDAFFINLPSNSGPNEITVSISEPNGVAEQAPEDNSSSFFITVDESTELLPVRNTFESLDGWTIASPSVSGGDLELMEGTIRATGFQNENVGQETWLVSPSFSTQNLTNATLLFDLAYAANEVGTDRLQVLVSNDCGRNFGDIIFDQSGEMLVTSSAIGEFSPTLPDDWRRISLDLSSAVLFAEIRLAFVFTNGGGNNLFLDNIEISPVSPDLVQNFEDQLTIYPNPALGNFQAALNLSNRASTVVTLLDLQGKIKAQFLEPLGLNQTFQFTDLRRGIYFLEVRTNGKRMSKRVVVTD